MKKSIIATLLGAGMLLALAFFFTPKAECWGDRCSRYIGRSCYSNSSCGRMQGCMLLCEYIDRYSLKGICR